MKKISEEIYSRINNEIYNLEGDRWWQPDFSLNLIRAVYNPVRIGYAKELFDLLIETDRDKINVLEVGCGGGILSEEIAKMGFKITGLDPSEASLSIARLHSAENRLIINYKHGTGENLPFEKNAFEVVLCCDVLEHVHDLPKVISEISRVLTNGGLFIYDTFNRTYLSKISTVNVLQKWKRWAILPPDLHVWEMFIKPSEMRSLLAENNLDWKEHRGIKPDVSYLKMLHYLRQRATGELTYEEFGKKFHMVENSSTRVMYMGYAIRGKKCF